MINKISIIVLAITIVIALGSCKKDNSDSDKKAILSMNVNGVPFTTDKANSFINSSNNTLVFATESQPNMHSISVISYVGNNINTDYRIDINAISSISNISQALFLANGNEFDMYSFPIISEKGYMNYRIVKKQTIGTGITAVKCDVDFSGVIYAGEEDSVIITNGSVRY